MEGSREKVEQREETGVRSAAVRDLRMLGCTGLRFTHRGGTFRIMTHSLLISPCSPPQVWTFGDMSLSSGSSGRYSVQTVTSDHGVVSSLVLSETLAQDFQLRYNCTAWNRFGTGTALVTLKEQGTNQQEEQVIAIPNPSFVEGQIR